MRDFYYILGVTKNCTSEEIKNAYRKLSKKFHPDVNFGEKFFEERFKEIQEAFEVLSDFDKRYAYDKQLNDYLQKRNNADELRTAEERIHKKYEAEFRKREEVLKQKMQEDFLRKQKNETENRQHRTAPPPVSKSSDKGKYDKLPGIALLSMMAIVFIIMFADSGNKSYKVKSQPLIEKPEDRIILNLENISESLSKSLAKSEFSFIQADEYKFIDIDGDSTDEILLEYFTGGAHCCFVYYLFELSGENNYNCILKYEGGENSLNITDGIIQIGFYEQLNGFYTCSACNINSKLPFRNFTPSFILTYKNKKFKFKNEQSSNTMLLANLNYLQSLTMPTLEADEGVRKAYAWSIITYYFNNNLNIPNTKSIFYQYYSGSDRDEIWEAILERITKIKSDLIIYS